MGRRKLNYENISAGFDRGTKARIDAVRHKGETRKEFLRQAVLGEIARRKQEQAKGGDGSDGGKES